MDSVGIGEAPDAAKFGDEGADTLGHIAERMNGLNMPNMGELGLSNIWEIMVHIPGYDRLRMKYHWKDGFHLVQWFVHNISGYAGHNRGLERMYIDEPH